MRTGKANLYAKFLIPCAPSSTPHAIVCVQVRTNYLEVSMGGLG
jgi:hypothetical protein